MFFWIRKIYLLFFKDWHNCIAVFISSDLDAFKNKLNHSAATLPYLSYNINSLYRKELYKWYKNVWLCFTSHALFPWLDQGLCWELNLLHCNLFPKICQETQLRHYFHSFLTSIPASRPMFLEEVEYLDKIYWALITIWVISEPQKY